ARAGLELGARRLEVGPGPRARAGARRALEELTGRALFPAPVGHRHAQCLCQLGKSASAKRLGAQRQLFGRARRRGPRRRRRGRKSHRTSIALPRADRYDVGIMPPHAELKIDDKTTVALPITVRSEACKTGDVTQLRAQTGYATLDPALAS